MAETVSFKVHGLKELQKALTQLPKELVGKNGGPVKTALMAATLPIMKTAQNTVPNRDQINNLTGEKGDNSGRLMRAISRRRATKVRKGSEAVQVFVRKGKKRDDESGAWYAPWVEFGAKGLPGTRWFTKALESNKETSTEIFRRNLAGAIARIAKKIGNENIRAVAAQVKKS
jgi:HK97 gp10 family phage protein